MESIHNDKVECSVCAIIYSKVHPGEEKDPFLIPVDEQYGIPAEDWELISKALETPDLSGNAPTEIFYILSHPYIDPEEGIMLDKMHEVRLSIVKEKKNDKEYFNVGRTSEPTRRTFTNIRNYNK